MRPQCKKGYSNLHKMGRQRFFSLLLFFLVISVTSAWADGGTRFFWENDAVFGDSDRYYTNGMRFELWFPAGASGRNQELGIFTNDSTTPDVDNHWGNFWRLRPGCRSLVGFDFGQTMFTSSNIRTPVVSAADRNYAAHLYLGGMMFESCGDRDVFFEFSIGALGKPAYGEQAQTIIHKLVKSPPPQGWKDQPPARLALQSYLEYRKRIYPWFGAVGFGRLGSVYITTGGGVQFRLGRYDDQSSMPGSGMFHVGAPPAKPSKTELYLFLESLAFFQFYDATLQQGGDGGLDRLYTENLLKIGAGEGDQFENSMIWNLLVPTSKKGETLVARIHLLNQLQSRPDKMKDPTQFLISYRLLTNWGSSKATDGLLWDLVRTIRPSKNDGGALTPLRAPRTVQTLTTVGFHFNTTNDLYWQISLSTGPSDFQTNKYATWHRWGSIQLGVRF